MEGKKEMTAHITSVGADAEQSSQEVANNSILKSVVDFNNPDEDFDDFETEAFRQMESDYLKTMTMTELFETVFEPQIPLIEDILYAGTYIFVGSPKVGKSFLMAQLAYHVSMGIPLWNQKVRKSPVLYFALEDSYRRLQARLYRMFGTEGNDNLHLATVSKQLGKGLDEQIKRFMGEHPDTGLIIIDTLKRVRETGDNEYSYSDDYDVIARLKDLAGSFGITMIIVHHTRKEKAKDIFEQISGSNGLFGAADGGLLLTKEQRTSNEATLEITGRDQPDQKLHLSRDPEKLVWNMESAETELWREPPDPLLERVASMLSTVGGRWEGSPSALCEWLNADMKPNALSLKLNVSVSRLYKDYGVCYKNHRCHDGRRITLWLNDKQP